ncbi:MAG TPA: hypothetical protein VJ044_15450 [Candidatus Hodarchaeales archaeon]|nr:hypothetical protein [Candidatus Hodarchaeales archaeon]
MGAEAPKEIKESSRELSGPSEDQLAVAVDRVLDSVESRAQNSLVVQGEKSLDEWKKFWLKNSIDNFRRFADPMTPLTPAAGFTPDMYPGFTKDDFARLADMLVAKL